METFHSHRDNITQLILTGKRGHSMADRNPWRMETFHSHRDNITQLILTGKRGHSMADRNPWGPFIHTGIT